MNSRCKAPLVFVLLLFVCFPVFPQSQVTGRQSGNLYFRKNAPYSADEETETTRTSAEGIRLVTKTRQRVYRDSEARTRVETFSVRPNDSGDEIATITINDPVAVVHYSIDCHAHRVHRTSVAPPQGNPEIARPVPPVRTQSKIPRSPGELQSESEPLGSKIVEGLLVEGTRTTLTIPEGYQGNDRTFIKVIETWSSNDLGIVILSRRSDPFAGEVVTRIANIVRTEPDPSFFQMPADYEIVEERPAVKP